MIRHRWRTHLKAATTEAAVVDLVSAYLGEWTREEVESIPPAAWPRNVRNKADIMSWMFRIGEVHSKFKGPAAALIRLQELLLFFTHAAVRVTQIASFASDPSSANDDPEHGESSCARPGGAVRPVKGKRDG